MKKSEEKEVLSAETPLEEVPEIKPECDTLEKFIDSSPDNLALQPLDANKYDIVAIVPEKNIKIEAPFFSKHGLLIAKSYDGESVVFFLSPAATSQQRSVELFGVPAEQSMVAEQQSMLTGISAGAGKGGFGDIGAVPGPGSGDIGAVPGPGDGSLEPSDCHKK